MSKVNTPTTDFFKIGLTSVTDFSSLQWISFPYPSHFHYIYISMHEREILNRVGAHDKEQGNTFFIPTS